MGTGPSARVQSSHHKLSFFHASKCVKTLILKLFMTFNFLMV